MDIAAAIVAFALLIGVVRCTDNTHLEKQVASQKFFELHGAEHFCLRSPKQMEIDRLNEELAKIKSN